MSKCESANAWSMELANEAIERCKEIKDGPSEEDKRKLLSLIAEHPLDVVHAEEFRADIPESCEHYCDECWTLSQLKRYMGIE